MLVFAALFQKQQKRTFHDIGNVGHDNTYTIRHALENQHPLGNCPQDLLCHKGTNKEMLSQIDCHHLEYSSPSKRNLKLLVVHVKHHMLLCLYCS